MLEINDAVDRVVAGMEGTPLVDSKNKRLIAYHEVGHAVVGSFLPHHDPVQKVTLIPRGQALGLTWYTPNEELGLESRAQLLASITTTLGGRAAEEEIFGKSEVTNGAINDLQKVTSTARQMVTRFGMSDLGPLALESQGGEVFLGGGFMSRSADYSEQVAALIDSQVQAIAEHCHNQARQIIRENREVIDQLVDLLIEQETIDGDQLRKILNEQTNLQGDKLVISG
jgi:cell division protease FtsH